MLLTFVLQLNIVHLQSINLLDYQSRKDDNMAPRLYELKELLIPIIDLLLKQFTVLDINFNLELSTSFWRVLFLKSIVTMGTNLK